MDQQILVPCNTETLQSCPSSVVEGQSDEQNRTQTIHIIEGSQETESHKTSTAVTNGAASVILEGMDASLIFPHRPDCNSSFALQWEGNKDLILQSEGSKSVGPILFSQAHTIVEVLSEFLKPSDAPLQIIIESQKVDEPSLEQIGNQSERNPSSKEVNSSNCDVVVQPNEINKILSINEGTPTNKDQVNVERTESLSVLQLIHKCYYCRFASESISVVLEHVKKKHPGKPTKTKTISGRDCPYCGLRLDQTAFFQHMRQYHEDAHPFRCGYCNFMGRDLNQLKHHCTKKHRGEPFKGFRRLVGDSTLSLGLQNGDNKSKILADINSIERDMDINSSNGVLVVTEGKMERKNEHMELIDSKGDTFLNCPVCQKKIKTLKYLKVHMRVHNKGRYKCGYCSYLSAYCLQVLVHCKKRHLHLQPRVKQHELDPMQDKNVVKNYDVFMEEVRKKCSKQPPEPDSRKWARKYSCPHCEYTCSYGASYRRHLTTHSNNPLPFRCHYCQFEGREKYYVRRHIQRIHRGFPAVVVDNNPIEPLKNVLEDLQKHSNTLTDVSSRNLATEIKNVPEELVRAEKDAARPELDPVVGYENVVTEEQGIKLGNNEQMNNVENECAMEEAAIDHISHVVTATGALEVVGGLENIMGVNECPDSESSRAEEDGGNDSVHPKGCEGLDNCLLEMCNSQQDAEDQLHDSVAQFACDNKQVPAISPVQETGTNFPADVKLSINVEIGGMQERVNISDGLPSEKDTVGISLESLLDVDTEKCENFAVQAVKERSKNTKRVGDTKIKTGAIKSTSKKKGNREKSSHKAWDFVAYRDGRYTYCVCGTRTVNKAFYKHIKKHIDSKRFGCGYCSYRSIERAKVRVHHTFIHPGLPLIINDYEESVKEDEGKNKTRNLQVSSGIEVKSNQQSNTKKESPTQYKVSPNFQCPICKKKISYHSYTIRRHLFSHCDYRPYKCGRCEFRGCSLGEVKQHSVFHGADLRPIIEPSGQKPPEGLEQLVSDCFNELQMKLGKKMRRNSKSNEKLIHPISASVAKEDSKQYNYQLITNEALIWSKSLSDGVCPWCNVTIPPSICPNKETFVKEAEAGCIKTHFKVHFYKPAGDSSSSECQLEEDGFLVPTCPPETLEEKDAIIMNGLMYYFINQPVMKESFAQKSQGDKTDMVKGQVGIIHSTDGLPGTIQVTDFLLTDLRHMLWGQVNELKPRRDQLYNSRKCGQQCKSSRAIQQHAESHATDKPVGTREESEQCDLQNQSETQGISQVPDGEVGVFFLGDDMEVATAVVVINSEAEEREMVLEVSS